MIRLLRRLFWLALLSGAGYAAYTAWQRRREPTPDGPPEWPPLDVDAPPQHHERDDWTTAPASEPVVAAAGAGTRWVDPVEGRCPDGYPIKLNANSGIYHVPGGRSYDRTVPERCYATEDDAIADGYRRAKV